MTGRKLLLIGGGGHCKSVLDSVSSCSIYEDIAIIDQPEYIGKNIGTVAFIGTDADLPALRQKGYTDAFVSVGSIGDTLTRVRLMRNLEKLGFEIPSIIAPDSHISDSCKIGKGVYIGKSANINYGCYIGDGSIINTAATIEHECKIGEFVHIAPGALVCGGAIIGNNSHIGAHSTILQGIKIEENVMVGAGCVVIRDIPAGKTVVGVPGHQISSKGE